MAAVNPVLLLPSSHVGWCEQCAIAYVRACLTASDTHTERASERETVRYIYRERTDACVWKKKVGRMRKRFEQRRSRTFQLLVGVSMLLMTVSLQLMGSSAAYKLQNVVCGRKCVSECAIRQGCRFSPSHFSTPFGRLSR